MLQEDQAFEDCSMNDEGLLLLQINFKDTELKLTINQEATIKDLVNTLFENGTIEQSTKLDSLSFVTATKRILTCDNIIKDIVEKQKDDVHCLKITEKKAKTKTKGDQASSRMKSDLKMISGLVELSQLNNLMRDPNMTHSIAEASKYFQNQITRILHRIQLSLEEQNFTSLMTKQNTRIETQMRVCLNSIGTTCAGMSNKILIFQKYLPKIKDANHSDDLKLHTFDKLYNEFSENNFVPPEIISLVSHLIDQKKKFLDMKVQYNIIKDQTNTKSLKQQQLDTKLKELKKSQENLMKQIEQYKSQALKIKTKFQQEIKLKDEENKELLTELKMHFQQIIELNEKIQSNKATIQSLTRQLQMAKQQRQAQSSIDPMIERIAKQLQMEKISRNAIQTHTKKVKIQKVLDVGLWQTLKSHICSSNRKKIKGELKPLISYVRNQHKIHGLTKKFHQLIDNKESLLFVGKSKAGKIFGAFTEEKLQIETRQLPSFSGVSFLFSFDDNKLVTFELEKGQNSMLYDLSLLVFGNSDLSIDFGQSKASSCLNEKNCQHLFRKAIEKDVQFLCGKDKLQEVSLENYYVFEINFK